jgi:hypothetical protein
LAGFLNGFRLTTLDWPLLADRLSPFVNPSFSGEATASENCFAHLDSENDGRAQKCSDADSRNHPLVFFHGNIVALKIAQFDSAKDGI